MKYDVVTIDWHPEQTRIWEHYLRKNCKGFNLVKLPDNKPFPSIECGAKSDVLLYGEYATDRIIYLDTDTIVQRNLAPLFDKIPDHTLALTVDFAMGPYGPFQDWIGKNAELIAEYKRAVGPYPVRHYYNGMMVFNRVDFDMRKLGLEWKRALGICQDRGLLLDFRILDEIALGCCIHGVVPEDMIWETPLEVHANICPLHKPLPIYPLVKGGYGVSIERPEKAWVLHYHSRKFLEPFGLGHLLDV